MGKIVAVANQKGGVGKTTTAVNLAGCLVELGKKVLLIDLDPQANATIHLGVIPEDINQNVLHFLLENSLSVLTRKINGFEIHLLPSSIELSKAEIELNTRLERERVLMNNIKEVKENYDFIIVDCPPNLGILTLNGLFSADNVLIPVQTQYLPLGGLTTLLELANAVAERKGKSDYVLGILGTMYAKREKVCEEILQKLKSAFPDLVFSSLIRRNVYLQEASANGKPVNFYKPSSFGAKDYREFTREFLQKIGG